MTSQMKTKNRVIWIYTEYTESALTLCVKLLKIVYVKTELCFIERNGRNILTFKTVYNFSWIFYKLTLFWFTSLFVLLEMHGIFVSNTVLYFTYTVFYGVFISGMDGNEC